MMINPNSEYYANQAGNGIPGFTGTRFQRVHGFFGRTLSGILPVLKYLGRKALSTGVTVAQDALQGDNFRESIKTSLKQKAADTIGDIAEDFAGRAKRYAQTGTGYKRRKTHRSHRNNTVSNIPRMHATAKHRIKKRPRKRLRKRRIKKHNKRKVTTLF